MKAMIFAAGKGTRLGPLTDHRPKALIPIHGVPILEWTIRNLVRHGFVDIIINVHHFPDQIGQFLQENENFGIRIELSDETNLLLETGGGLKKASGFFKDGPPFLLYNVDVLTDLDLNKLYRYHEASGAIATLAVRHRDTQRYLATDQNGYLCGWKNIQTGEAIISRPESGAQDLVAFSGIHVVNPEILNYLPDKEVFPVMEWYLDLARHHHIQTFLHDETRWLDIGKPGRIEEAEKLFPELGEGENDSMIELMND